MIRDDRHELVPATGVLLPEALVVDERGKPTNRFLKARSDNWDEVATLTNQLYTPCRLKADLRRKPSTSVYTTQVGAFQLSRLTMGASLEVNTDQGSSRNVMALTLLNGRNVYSACSAGHLALQAGETLVADVSATRLSAQLSDDTHALNLVFSHDSIAARHIAWYGMPAAERLWQEVFKLEHGAHSLLPLLDYATRCISTRPEQVAEGALGRHLEELIGMHLLSAWRRAIHAPEQRYSGSSLHVRRAEEFIEAHLDRAPTRTEIARAAGVSVRTLNDAFLRSRGVSPMVFQRQMRLRRVRDELQAACADTTVTQVACKWGFVHLSQFSRQYREHFGEMPSETLRRSRV